jgi:hypothetical protein
MNKEDMEDLKQEVYIAIMTWEGPSKTPKGRVQWAAQTVYVNWIKKEENRRRLERENADEIVRNTTPTLLNQYAGGPEDFYASEQELVRRWESMSPLLRRVAKRTFFGYTESPEKVARDLGMTEGAVNMARTRIKQHMNGANE